MEKSGFSTQICPEMSFWVILEKSKIFDFLRFLTILTPITPPGSKVSESNMVKKSQKFDFHQMAYYAFSRHIWAAEDDLEH